jgi:hypothetical protein
VRILDQHPQHGVAKVGTGFLSQTAQHAVLRGDAEPVEFPAQIFVGLVFVGGKLRTLVLARPDFRQLPLDPRAALFRIADCVWTCFRSPGAG